MISRPPNTLAETNPLMSKQKSSKCGPPVVSGWSMAVAVKVAGGPEQGGEMGDNLPNGPGAVAINPRERVTGPSGFGSMS
jgi:hypothetical protein